jgi:hypothetical protein
MSSDPLLPDLPDVPEDQPDAPSPERQSDGEESETGADVEHPTGEQQAQENRDREPPA